MATLYSPMDQSEDSLHLTNQSETSLFNSMDDQPDTDDEEKETYYFESDHIALKGNPDYHSLLRTIALLEAQRIQAIKDLDTLHDAKKEALADPIQFVQKLQRGVDLGLPKQQKVPDLPEIQWEKYTNNLDFTFGTHRHMTRLKRQLMDGNKSTSGIKEEVRGVVTDQEQLVRGRIKTESKPDTFNQLWTTEEQKRLEDLLLVYPPEEVEAKRFQKIANALGNRTATQVQSRVQKYFIKLARARLPIPGRMPPNIANFKRRAFSKSKYHNISYNSSTFLASVTPPVLMADDDYDDSFTPSQDGSTMFGNDDRGDDFDGHDDVSDDETIPVNLRSTPEYQEFMKLKRLKRRKQEHQARQGAEHIGFKCDRCECEPIVGTRWHCTDCPPDIAVDFCENCVDCVYETASHNSSHRLKPKHTVDTATVNDLDYMSFQPGTTTRYNYLDSNYMPAT